MERSFFLNVFAGLSALGFFLSPANAAEEAFPLPSGWGEMDDERKQEYRDLWADFQSQNAEIKLSKEEKSALSESEKKAYQQAKWEIRTGFQETLANNGFVMPPYSALLEESVKAGAKKAATGGSFDWGGESASLVGTVIYDSGFPTIGFGGGEYVGNKFDTATGFPMLASGTISTVRAAVVPGPANTNSTAGVLLLGPQTGSGGAAAITTLTTSASGQIDTISFSSLSVNYTGASFFALLFDFASGYIPVAGTGTNLGQGHHAVVGYSGGMFPNITDTFNFGGALNAYVRVSGNIVDPGTVPVELQKEVE